MKKRIKRIILILAVAFSSVIFILFFTSFFSEKLASLFNLYVGGAVRYILSLASSVLPCSLFEVLVICTPIALSVFIISLFRAKDKACLREKFVFFTALISFGFSLYASSIGFAYNSEPLSSSLVRVDAEIDESTIKLAAERLLSDVRDCANCETVSVKEAEKELFNSYKSLFPKRLLPYPSVKKSLFSKLYGKLRILSLYSPFTSEICINTEIPEYMQAFTLAHEYAHSLGASGEGDANFLAYLSSVFSNDPHLTYSASLSMLEYVMPYLSEKDREDIYSRLPSRAVRDVDAYRKYIAKNESILGEVTDGVNDAHLSSYGESRKYSYTVYYVTAYFLLKTEKSQQ